jgi:hypothetical protein
VFGLTSKRIRADEIWSFCNAKKKNVPAKYQGQFGFGDVWTWTAIDADSKLMVSWQIGRRGAQDAAILMRDVASRLANRVQPTHGRASRVPVRGSMRLLRGMLTMRS